MIEPAVSIILPVWNCEKYIIEAVESCLSQDYSNFEVIVVDDASTDGTLDVLQSYKKHLKPSKFNRLRIIQRERNGHTGAALNTGIKNMKGEWFKEMQADDVLLPNALRDMIKTARKHPNKKDVIFYADYNRIDKDGRIKMQTPMKSLNDLPSFEFNNLLLRTNIGNGDTILIHKSALEKHGLFNETTKHEDYELRLRWCVLQKCGMYHIQSFVASYREHLEQYGMSNGYTHLRDENIKIKREIISKIPKEEQERHIQYILKNCVTPDEYQFFIREWTLEELLQEKRFWP